MAGIATPTALARFTSTTDPYLREARGPLDRIRSRIPGLSDNLPARRDVFGRALPARAGVGPDIVSPVYTSTDRDDPTVRALLTAGIGISAPRRTVSGRELTPQEYSRYQEVSGSIFNPQLDTLTGGADWRGMGDEHRESTVKRVVDKARKARIQLMLQAAPKREAAALLDEPWAAFADAR